MCPGSPTCAIIPQKYLLALRTGERLPKRKGGQLTNGGLSLGAGRLVEVYHQLRTEVISIVIRAVIGNLNNPHEDTELPRTTMIGLLFTRITSTEHQQR